MKRTSSTKNTIKKKPKVLLNTEDSIDYTKSLTSEDTETAESGFQELDIAENIGKIKTEKKKIPPIKKTVPKSEKENKSFKKVKGKPNTTNGGHILIST